MVAHGRSAVVSCVLIRMHAPIWQDARSGVRGGAHRCWGVVRAVPAHAGSQAPGFTPSSDPLRARCRKPRSRPSLAFVRSLSALACACSRTGAPTLGGPLALTLARSSAASSPMPPCRRVDESSAAEGEKLNRDKQQLRVYRLRPQCGRGSAAIAQYFRTRSLVSAADIDGWRERELMAPQASPLCHLQHAQKGRACTKSLYDKLRHGCAGRRTRVAAPCSWRRA
jgi:hypothetical protein